MRRELHELLAALSWHRDYCRRLEERATLFQRPDLANLNRGAAVGFQAAVERLEALLRPCDCEGELMSSQSLPSNPKG